MWSSVGIKIGNYKVNILRDKPVALEAAALLAKLTATPMPLGIYFRFLTNPSFSLPSLPSVVSFYFLPIKKAKP